MPLPTHPVFEEPDLSPRAQQFLTLRDDVIDHWESTARASIEGAQAIPSLVLTDSFPAFFDHMAEALSPQYPRADATSDNIGAAAHGQERARMTDYRVDQIAEEYQLFQASIEAVAKGRMELHSRDWEVISRSINLATVESIRAFMTATEAHRSKAAATLTHDMRTPLAVIGSAAELIGVTRDIDMARKASAKISSNVRRLDAMTTELIDALVHRKGSDTTLFLTQFDMFTLVEELREQYSGHRGRGIELQTVGESVVGFWCKDSIRRALENLINNAIKYGDAGKVRVKTVADRGRLTLSVKNWGEPISKDEQQQIFEYLKREENVTSASGWGIGLPFVKSVAESHGGTVAVDSSAMTGTTFLIDIPVDCRPYNGAPPSA
jgi:signal transduction histidine kinase